MTEYTELDKLILEEYNSIKGDLLKRLNYVIRISKKKSNFEKINNSDSFKIRRHEFLYRLRKKLNKVKRGW